MTVTMKHGRLLMALAILAVIGASVLGFRPSDATLTSANSSTISASTAGIGSLLHLYSQGSDPDGLTGYYTQPGTTTLAATGTDASLALNLGKQSNANTNETRVFTIKAATPLPSGITSITVTSSLVADPTTGLQPIRNAGFSALGGTARTASVTLTAGQKMQCNVRTNVAKPSGTVYKPKVIITVTYTGYTGTFYQYTVPFTVTAS
jgi:hypothetical protein